MSDKLNNISDNLKPNNKATGELIEGHEYDGIKELDHPLPRWWLNLFYATIIFSVGYVGYYEFLGGPTHQQQLDRAMQKITKNQNLANLKAEQENSNIDVQSLLNDKDVLAVGEQAYLQTCAACHSAKGEGLIGPNLTDKYWLHSKGDFQGILTSILKGFPEKGMPPWEAIIPKEKHAPLAAYVISLQGTNPPNAKAPQGELVE
jgi:cytochrome c oxidase cbb3-type subunit III